MEANRWNKLRFFFRFHIKFQHIHNFFIPLFRKKHKIRVFCIGDVKTGTQSLYHALLTLGYRAARLPFLDVYSKYDEEVYIKKLKNSNYDAFVDYPMGMGELFKKIDKSIPNSKFILTTRDKELWRKSYKNYFRGFSLAKSNLSNFEKREKKFEEHNQSVMNYFNNKPDKLLIIDITSGEGWEKLCPFLNKPIPNKPFPHRNKAKYKKPNNTKNPQ